MREKTTVSHIFFRFPLAKKNANPKKQNKRVPAAVLSCSDSLNEHAVLFWFDLGLLHIDNNRKTSTSFMKYCWFLRPFYSQNVNSIFGLKTWLWKKKKVPPPFWLQSVLVSVVTEAQNPEGRWIMSALIMSNATNSSNNDLNDDWGSGSRAAGRYSPH